MSRFIIILFGLLILLPCKNTNAQCTSSSGGAIADADTSYFNISVDNAFNDSLGVNGQGLCAVCVNFEHDFVGDLLGELIAPDGQSVVILGPPTLNSINTQFVNWDICFLAPSLMAIPDAGFTPVWNNIQPWAILSSYTGSYYPFNGTLDDFDGGPVNGTWTLKFTDISNLGAGSLLDWELIFCDDQGLTCVDCEPDAGMVTSESLSYCEGDPSLEFEITPSYNPDPPDPNVYDLLHIVLEDDVISEYQASADLTTYDAGEYQVCGMSIIENEIVNLPTPDGSFGLDSINALINQGTFCAELNTNCFFVEIIEVSDTVYLNEIICDGDSYVVDGVAYSDQDIYTINVNSTSCDSVIILDLQLIELDAYINPAISNLTCLDGVENLYGGLSMTGANTTYQWFTNNGAIDGPDNQESVDVTAAGIYFLVLEEGNCRDTASIEVFDESQYPNLSFLVDTLNCIVDSVMIQLMSDLSIDNYNWTGGTLSDPNTANPFAFEEGWYFVEVLASNGCVHTDSVEVIYDGALPDPSFEFGIINCINGETQILTEINGTYDFYWEGPPSFGSSIEASPTVNDGGTYQLTITATNGCTDVSSVEVLEYTDIPEVTLVGDTIFCDEPVAMVSALIPDGSMIEWSGPNGFNEKISNISIISQGLYTVEIIDTNGCELDTFVNVPLDNIYPFVAFGNMSPTIECNDSTQVDPIYSNVFSNTNYSWTGPVAFTSNSPSPWFTTKGKYFVTIVNPNGCTYLDSVVVQNGPGIPDVGFLYNDINCFIDNTDILPSDIVSNSFEWDGPGYMGMELSPNVSVGGFYHVTVTDNTTGCKTFNLLEILEDFEEPVISINGGSINCANDPVQLSFNSSLGILTNEWTLPDGSKDVGSSLSTTDLGWYYLDVVAENGCVQNDSFLIELNQMQPSLIVRDTFIGCDQLNIPLIAISDMVVDYNWTGPGTFDRTAPSPLINLPGTYQVTVTAQNDCTNVGVIEVVEDIEEPTINVSGVLSIDCQSPTTQINIESNAVIISYIWTGPEPIGNIPDPIIGTPGDYTVEIVARNNCRNEISFTIVALDQFPQFQINNQPISCATNETATITIDPLLNSTVFSWTGPNNYMGVGTTVILDTEGTYFVEATDLNGCSSITPVLVVSEVVLPVVTQVLSDNIDCYNPTVELGIWSSTDIVTYTWDGPSGFMDDEQTVVVDVPGEYVVEIFAATGCSSIETIVVIEDYSEPEVTIFGSEINCLENKVPLSFMSNVTADSLLWEGPNNYSSTLPNPTVNILGSYVLSVTGPNGCIGRDTFEVIEDFSQPDIQIFTAHLPCNGNPVQLELITQDSATYKWFGPGGFYSEEIEPWVIDTGEYLVYATGINGCIREDTVLVDDVPVPPEYTVETEKITCYTYTADLITFLEDPDGTVEWEGPNGFYSAGDTATVFEVGDYLMIATGTNGCKDTMDVLVGIDTIAPYAEIGFPDTLRCTGKEIFLDGFNSDVGNNYEAFWSTASGNILNGENTYSPEINRPGYYNLQITDIRNGCTDVDSVLVLEEVNTLIGMEYEITEPQCAGFLNGSVQIGDVLGGFAPFEYSFDGSNYVDNNEFFFIGTGMYNVTVKDSAGCTADTLMFMPDGLLLNVDLGPDIIASIGEVVEIEALLNTDQSNITSVTWNSSASIPCSDCLSFDISLLNPTQLDISVLDVNGCEASDSKLITITEASALYIPNAFSPNGDGINEEFIIYQGAGVEKIELLNILDNWGNIVHEAFDFLPEDPVANWSGIYRNKPLPIGVYAYILEFTLINGEKRQRTGTIMLMR